MPNNIYELSYTTDPYGLNHMTSDFASKDRAKYFALCGDVTSKSFNDHYIISNIFSRQLGYEQNVPPEIIGHWTNLKIIASHIICTRDLNRLQTKNIDQLYEDFHRANHTQFL